MNTENVRWILCCSVTDQNYKDHIPKLTDKELLYCLENETRKTSLKRLENEAKKRGLHLKSN